MTSFVTRYGYVVVAILGMIGGLLCIQLSTGTGTDRPVRATQYALVKTDLNTAVEIELRKLPKMSAGSAKAIVAARTKSSFKNWNDFVARRVVPTFTERAIKDVVTF
jgi:DNA uptake protein ComE-like DNA-binding protein